MNKSSKKALGKNTFQLEITVDKADVEAKYLIAFEQLAKELQVAGFRKGTVPKNIAEKHLSKNTIYQKVVELILPEIYTHVVKEHALEPIISPKVELLSAKENEDWKISYTIAQRPEVDLKEYKKLVGEFNKANNKTDIWVPGTPKPEDNDKDKNDKKVLALNKLLDHLSTKIKVEISDLIIDEAVDRKLSQLVDDVQKIGLSMDNYLKSKNETLETLKDKYKNEVNASYKLDFLISAIADAEKIAVDKADFDKFFSQIEDEKTRTQAQQNAYYYASIIRMQKTLDYLSSL